MARRKIFVHPLAVNDSRQVGEGTRIWAFSHVMKGACLGARCNIGEHVYVEEGVTAGEGVTIKNGVCLWRGVVLEDYVFIGPQVAFTNDRYPRSPRNPLLAGRYADEGWLSPTLVRRGASIGANATVCCGIVVGCYALIAAGAVVTHDVPDFALVAGCPARGMGWVCLCGCPLKKKRYYVCSDCGRRYRLGSGGLVPMERCAL